MFIFPIRGTARADQSYPEHEVFIANRELLTAKYQQCSRGTVDGFCTTEAENRGRFFTQAVFVMGASFLVAAAADCLSPYLLGGSESIHECSIGDRINASRYSRSRRLCERVFGRRHKSKLTLAETCFLTTNWPPYSGDMLLDLQSFASCQTAWL